ncbi:MAG TPA: hypothetical protein VJK48_04560 [Chlamydiales bacterium]|nr:hypothetical protein [Chlamydiales bacterium]
MCLSIFLAQVIGSYLFLASLAMLVHQARFKKTTNDLVSNPTLLTLSGMLSLIAGLLIVVDHNIWVPYWPVLITIIGWILLIKGLMKLFTPDAVVKVTKDMQGSMSYTLLAWIRLAVGVVLIWAGFSQM